MFVGEFNEIDLTKKIDVITDDEIFISGIKKWLFNNDFNLLGNILNSIDDMGDKIVINKMDDLILQFSCKNIYGDDYIIYLLDDKKGNERSLLAVSSNGDIGYYNLSFYNKKILISTIIFDNDKDMEGHMKRHIVLEREIAG